MTIDSYEKAEKFLAGGKNKNSRKDCNNTWIERRGEDIAVRLHETDVVLYKKDGGFVLDTGGWHTVTTKDRINGYAPHGVKVYSDRGIWMVYGAAAGGRYSSDWASRATICEFSDGLEFDKDCKPLNARPSVKLITQELDKRVKKYIDGYAKHVVENGLEQPSNGDCWGCLMSAADGASKDTGNFRGVVTDVTKLNPMGFDHILSHFAEKYYVPSLFWKAMKSGGFGPAWPGMIEMQREKYPNEAANQVRRVLRGYFKRIKSHLVEELVSRGGVFPEVEEANA
jgi:hypothetical protein